MSKYGSCKFGFPRIILYVIYRGFYLSRNWILLVQECPVFGAKNGKCPGFRYSPYGHPKYSRTSLV